MRSEVNKEISAHLKAQRELNMLKKQNYILWREMRNQQGGGKLTAKPNTLTEEDQ